MRAPSSVARVTDSSTTQFYSSLNTGALGLDVDYADAIELAAEFGYGGIDPNLAYLRELPAAERADLGARLADRGLRWGAAGLPVGLLGDAARFGEQLAALPHDAGILRAAGVERVGTFVLPMSDSLTYRRHFGRLTERVALVDEVLAGEGLRLGLEYVGPKTLWATKRFPFIHTLAETLELLAAVGSPNVGVVLDTYHWYTAAESVEDLRKLRAEQVVGADINDAHTGMDRDELLDLDRELPGATGVIDVASFLDALRHIGYAGPVKVEPFNAELKALPPREAIAKTAEALRTFDLADPVRG